MLEKPIFLIITTTLLAGPSFLGKTLLLRFFSRLTDRDVYIFTKLTPEQYSKSQIKLKEVREEMKPLIAYENAVIVFDVILGTTTSEFIDQFFKGGRHNNLDKFLSITILFWFTKKNYKNY